ncbi:hypothetical protein HYD66_03840 [Mycoplasmopsis bovis]|nr:hypothetical protein [Mycoplasmopsis bovis]QQH55172.1 hypothetical protein HYD66_03840 [Mycoplasmopsis bovis]
MKQRATDPSSKNFDFFINLSSPFKAINSLKMLYKSINKLSKVDEFKTSAKLYDSYFLLLIIGVNIFKKRFI